jgi:hypothetical protein
MYGHFHAWTGDILYVEVRIQFLGSLCVCVRMCVMGFKEVGCELIHLGDSREHGNERREIY